MKPFFTWMLILGFGGLFVMAGIFRSQRARDLLRFGRNAMWLYIVGVFILGAIEFYRRGF